ncbi:hypothetical protein ACQP3J_30470, partial [Escherichia coli]
EIFVIIPKQLKVGFKHNFPNKSKICLKYIWLLFVKIPNSQINLNLSPYILFLGNINSIFVIVY